MSNPPVLAYYINYTTCTQAYISADSFFLREQVLAQLAIWPVPRQSLVSGKPMAVSCAEFAMTVTITSRLVTIKQDYLILSYLSAHQVTS